MKYLIHLTLFLLLLAPSLRAQEVLITPTAITSSTAASDPAPAVHLINGSGLSGTPTLAALGTHANNGSSLWVTVSAGFATDYFATLPPPVLTCTLPSVQSVSELVIWGYDGNPNEGKSFIVTFSTDGTTYGNAATVTQDTLLGSGAGRLPFPGGARLATHVRVEIVDNYYISSDNFADRVGLGELRFVAAPNSAPVITNRTFAVYANHANSSLVGSVAATDPDAGQSLSYAITAGNTGGVFALHPTNGQITVANASALNATTTPSYALTVQVTDNGFPSLTSSATVAINVSPVLVETIYGYTFHNRTLVRFDSATPGTVTTIGPTTWTAPSGQVALITLHGMDFRPSDGKLYCLGYGAVFSNGYHGNDDITQGEYGLKWRFYTVNTDTGALTPYGLYFFMPETFAPFLGSNGNLAIPQSMQWNPVVDRPTVAMFTLESYGYIYDFWREGDPDAIPGFDEWDAAQSVMQFAPGDQFSQWMRPSVPFVAYTNSVAGALSTTLYGWCGNNTHAQNRYAGALTTISGPFGERWFGSAGVRDVHTVNAPEQPGENINFQDMCIDISGATGTLYASHAVDADGNLLGYGLYTRDLVSGMETFLGNIPMPIQHISVAPPTVASFAIAGIPAQAPVGSPITGVTITARDSGGNTVTSFANTVTFGGTAGITGTSANFVAGVLAGVSITPANVGTGQTFTVSDGASHTGSASFDVQTRFAFWAGGASATADSNQDGVANGVAWLLGAANPSVNAPPLLPTLDLTSDAAYFIYTYRRSDAANSAPGTTITAQYSDTLTNWTDATPQGTDIIITPTDDFYGAGVDKVEIAIKKTFITSGKLFLRTSLLTN